ncbi:MAG: NAD(P)-dependent oxidoreductase [Myxococcales bacterium]|nr:NAD(P)-dependent oxidoreductase [Myxococcota bacterium]MDW8281823.1 NAD(P)-dependent oxidoreductase [Myxococcales bacterium]
MSDLPSPLRLPPLEAEKKPPLSLDEALAEAHRCLSCFDAPCTNACPTHIDVPRFIKRIATGNIAGAARTILSANVLGASCARVCPTEVLCEGACVLGDHHRPIAIGLLQRFATDYAMARGIPPLRAGPRRPGSVGIIGAGPAGLACAAELVQAGYEAVVYEAAEWPGGLNTYGVAQYKMTPRVSLQEVEWLARCGLDIRCGVRVGVDVSLAELEARHDAIFVGVGMGAVPPLGLPGEDLPNVVDALDFIADLKLGRPPLIDRPLRGARIAVIGGGNTSIDVTTQAARAGAATVWLLYRRDQDTMPAYAHELHLSIEHGTRLLCHTVPVRIVGQDRVTGLEIEQVRPEGEGRTAPLVPVPGSRRLLEVEAVVRATGQGGVDLLRQLPGVAHRGGVVQVDEWGRTTNPRYWAGGDCISGGKEVVNAVAEGKRAAQGIIRDILARKTS